MWKIGFISCLIASFLVLVGTEALRSYVHRYRERVHGIGGTQDIAMWGALLGYVCLLGALVCGIMLWVSS